MIANRPLTGRISFHIQLASSSSLLKRRKRKRTPILDPTAVETQLPTPPALDRVESTEAHAADADVDLRLSPAATTDDDEILSLIGWIFIESSSSRRFLLSVPHCYQKLVCDAGRNEAMVRLDRFTLLPIMNNALVFEAVLEVCDTDGMTTLPQPIGMEKIACRKPIELLDTTNKKHNKISTLEEISRDEPVGHHDTQQLYSFRGTVLAVSPILILPSSSSSLKQSAPPDPFVLLEVVQDYKDDACDVFSAIVVLRRACLGCHASATPGESILIYNAKKQAWRIPDLLGLDARVQLEREQSRVVPRWVFVVDESTEQIQWADWTHQRQQSNRPPNHPATPPPRTHSCEARYTFPSFPESPLPAIEGRICAVHWMIGSEQTRRLHFVELTTDAGQEASLFLTYFPMSSALLISVRMGATIRATNVFKLGLSGYAAGLRSHVAVIKTSMVENSSKVNLEHFPSFELSKQRRSYSELWYRRFIDKIWNDSRFSLLQKLYNVAAPTRDDLVNSLLVPIQPKSGSSKRNVYAEFFDHGVFEVDASMGGQVSTSRSGLLATFRRHGLTPPLCISLSDILERGLALTANRLEKYMTDNLESIQIGWAASIHTKGTHCLQETFHPGANLDDDVPVYSFGFGSVATKAGNYFATLSNGSVAIPVVISSDSQTETDPVTVECYVWARLQSVIVSCICIDVDQSTERTDTVGKPTFLPPYANVGEQTNATNGCCSVIQVNRRFFIVSLSLVCSALLSSDFSDVITSAKTPNEDEVDTQSVEACLRARLPNSHVPYIRGILARCYYKAMRCKADRCSGYMLTIAHSPSCHDRGQYTSCLQSVEVKLPLKLDTAMRQILYSAANCSVSIDKLTIGLTWWKIATCPWTCSLLAGGWDEYACMEADQTSNVIVLIPSSCANHDSQRGYTRLRCSLDDTVATISFQPNAGPPCLISPHFFDNIGGGKFVVGMLDKRPHRRRFGDPAQGELVLHPTHAGIPKITLSSLLSLLCLDLQQSPARSHMAPSLAREIRGANLLGVSYCQVVAECSLCYSKLLLGPNVTTVPTISSETRGEETHLNYNNEDRPSYWSNPIREDDSSKKTASTQRSTPKNNQAVKTTLLHCPNHCPVNRFGAVKWECSGILDDGTGQAKLFAERDAALCLLGIPAWMARVIEDGAWQKSGGVGIVYSKTMPPKPEIRSSVFAARSLALQHLRAIWAATTSNWGIKRRQLTDDDVLHFLTPVTRAEYLLQRFCQSSKEPLRPLTYFVRCKPLADGVVHVNQTAIEVGPTAWAQGHYSSGRGSAGGAFDVATYALPPLKLNLIDCCSCECCSPLSLYRNQSPTRKSCLYRSLE